MLHSSKSSRCYSNILPSGEIDDYSPCACAVRVDKGVFICPYGGNLYLICGYVGQCGGVVPPSNFVEFTQLSFGY